MTQEIALSILKTGANVFLTGEPGSGKTHVIDCFIAHLRKYRIEPAITASTGIAATHIGGMTIHSWSGIGIKKELSPWDIKRISSNRKVSARIKKAHTLIIDEISMLDGKTLMAVDRVCKAVRSSAAPFGGIQVILVGDFFQLPPVISHNNSSAAALLENEPMQFAFNSPAWTPADLSVCYLSEQHRQSEMNFLQLLSAIRSGSISIEHRECLNQRLVTMASKDMNITKLFTHNEDVDRINSMELQKLEGKSNFFDMEERGNALLIQHLKRGCLSPEHLELKLKSVVMFTKNNSKLGFVNGTLGTVMGLDKERGLPVIKTREGKVIVAEPMEWSIEENGEIIAAIKQIPLRLAWAITIHKSQGMSLDAAFIDLSEAFVEGQGYVALSRVRTLNGLMLASYNDKSLTVHPVVKAKDYAFQQASKELEAKFLKSPKEDLLKIANNFIKSCGGKTDSIPTPIGKAYSVGTIRAKHSNAYKPWNKEEEQILLKYYSDGKKTKEIAHLLGRQSGGIRSRLKKLGEL